MFAVNSFRKRPRAAWDGQMVLGMWRGSVPIVVLLVQETYAASVSKCLEFLKRPAKWQAINLEKLSNCKRTLKRTEATIHDQFEIAQLALREGNGGEGCGLGLELVVAGSIAGDEVLQDTTVGRVGHSE